MFAEFFAPAICSLCAYFGGGQIGFETPNFPVNVAVGWLDHRLKNGKMDDDTLMVSASAKVSDHFGVFASYVFTPDGKPRGYAHVEAGPFAEVQLTRDLSVRAYVVPGGKRTAVVTSLIWRF
jgi:hypothetical protein